MGNEFGETREVDEGQPLTKGKRLRPSPFGYELLDLRDALEFDGVENVCAGLRYEEVEFVVQSEDIVTSHS